MPSPARLTRPYLASERLTPPAQRDIIALEWAQIVIAGEFIMRTEDVVKLEVFRAEKDVLLKQMNAEIEELLSRSNAVSPSSVRLREIKYKLAYLIKEIARIERKSSRPSRSSIAYPQELQRREAAVAESDARLVELGCMVPTPFAALGRENNRNTTLRRSLAFWLSKKEIAEKKAAVLTNYKTNVNTNVAERVVDALPESMREAMEVAKNYAGLRPIEEITESGSIDSGDWSVSVAAPSAEANKYTDTDSGNG